MRSKRVLIVLLVVAACQIEKVAVPSIASRVALHGVLSVTATTQVVLLERTRNGTITTFGQPFDLVDPVTSDEGVAETDAIVSLTMPDGRTIYAIEDNRVRNDLKGKGIYRFSLPGDVLQRNGSYHLSVLTQSNERLTAETSVPTGVPAMSAEDRTFDRSRDTIALQWPASPGARAYFVRIDTPLGPRSFFTDSTSVRLTGELRNVDVTSLPHVFFPGFPQAVTVSAVDSNYYDWFRTHNDVLSGTGLVNRVHGGLGVFGSLVRLRYQNLEVVTPQTEPVAGKFVFSGTANETAGTPYLSLTIYLESPAARGDQGDALSGRYTVRPRFGYTGCLTCGLLGTVRDGQVEIALLNDWSGRDTVDLFRAKIHGDTLVGTYRIAGGAVHFVKTH